MSAPPSPKNAGKPDPRPRSFLGIRIVWRDSQCADYGLPGEVRKYISKVQNTGGLSYDTYLELADHFRAGLADGRTPQDLIAGLGDPKTLSRNLARTDGQQFTYYLTRTAHTFLWLLLALIALYAGMWLSLRWATPNPTIDYYALLNKRTLATPSDSHAWPIYLPVVTHSQFTWGAISSALQDETLDYLHYHVKPGDARWPAAQAYLTDIAPLLSQLRLAAKKPHLGLILSPWSPENVRRTLSETATTLPASPPPIADHPASRLAAGMFQEHSLDELVLVAHCTQPLMSDMYLAAQQNQPARICDNFQTLLAISSQLRQIPLETSRFKAQRITAGAVETIAQIALAAPGLLSQAQIATIRLQARAEIQALTIFAPIEPEFHDRIQRLYTNDNASGRITRDGAIYLCSGMPGLRDDIITQPPSWKLVIQAELSLPILYLLLPTRREAVKEHDLLVATGQLNSLAPWRADPHPALADFNAEALGLHKFMTRFFIHEQTRWPLTHRLLYSTHRKFQLNDALLAIAQYHARHNRWPKNPADLVPEFLPHTPRGIDPDEALIIKETLQGICIYSLGPNGIDDNGLYSLKAYEWSPGNSQPAPPGDTVYFPAGGRRPPLMSQTTGFNPKN